MHEWNLDAMRTAFFFFKNPSENLHTTEESVNSFEIENEKNCQNMLTILVEKLSSLLFLKKSIHH